MSSQDTDSKLACLTIPQVFLSEQLFRDKPKVIDYLNK